MNAIPPKSAFVEITTAGATGGATDVTTGVTTSEFAPVLKRTLGVGRAAVIEIVFRPEAITSRSTLTDFRARAGS
jgi:hypothetical protein